MLEKNPFIVSAEWLVQQLDRANIVVVDASWYLPNAQRDARQEYLREHIPNAVFFDHNALSDRTSTLPNTIARPETFARAMGDLGLANDETVVVYDQQGYFSAPRAWWLLRIMGATSVFILDGGFDNWKEHGFPISNTAPALPKKIFSVNFNDEKLVTLNEMRSIVKEQSVQIVDARANNRFMGLSPEPRPNVRAGHMPQAKNVPYSQIAENGYLKPNSELIKIFERAGVDVGRPVVTSCGSGMTAAALALALEGMGNDNVRLYDGSWSEWGALDDTPVVTGLPCDRL